MVADDVLAIEDISVEESEDLPKILDPLVSEAALAFASGSGTPSLPAEALSEAVEKSTPALWKLKVRAIRTSAAAWNIARRQCN